MYAVFLAVQSKQWDNMGSQEIENEKMLPMHNIRKISTNVGRRVKLYYKAAEVIDEKAPAEEENVYF